MDKKGITKGQTQVTGYTIVQAKDIDAAKSMLTDHPHLMMPKASLDILEIMPIM